MCLRFRLYFCLRLSTFVCICLRLLALACAPLCCCATKVAERKTMPKNAFFISAFLSFAWSMCQHLRVQWAGFASNRKQCLWQCRGLRRHLAGSAVPLLWLQSLGKTAQTPKWLEAAEKIRQPVRDFLREKLAREKNRLFRKNMGLKTQEKSQTIFLDFWPWSVCRVFFSKSHTRRRFFQLDMSWRCSQHVTPACQQKGLCHKAAKPSKSSAGAYFAGHPLRKQPWKENKKISWRGSAPGVEQLLRPPLRPSESQPPKAGHPKAGRSDFRHRRFERRLVSSLNWKRRKRPHPNTFGLGKK